MFAVFIQLYVLYLCLYGHFLEANKDDYYYYYYYSVISAHDTIEHRDVCTSLFK